MEGILRIGATRQSQGSPLSENTFSEGFTVHKAQLLNILNLKSSSAERNFHGYKVPSEYTVKMTAVLYILLLTL